jgi:WD40-like Beta Propeller Repeat
MERREARQVSTDGGPPGRRRWGMTLALLCAVSAAPLGASFACSAGAATTQATSSENSGGGSTGVTNPSSGGGGEGGGFFTTGTGMTASPLKVSPELPTLKLEVPLAGPAPTVQFSCLDISTNQPYPGASWVLDSPTLGTIDATGLFTANGAAAGDVKVTCKSGSWQAFTSLKITVHALENSGGLPPDQITLLQGSGGQTDAGWQMLYPYDLTVFPRGILAPEVHLTSGNSPGDVYYMHIVSDYEYEGFFKVSAANTQIQMSQAAWDGLTNSAKGKKVEVQVSKLSNNQKFGPISRQWTLADGKLHGTIYYNTYNSPLANQNGAMLRIKGASTGPEVLLGNCTVCHSISADGSTAAAANHSGAGGTFDLTGGNVNPPNLWQDTELAAFAALYPKNGEVLVINGAPGGSYPPNTPGTSATWYSSLRTKAGAVIPNSGIESYYAMSPVFSHDGSMLAFNDRSPVWANNTWPGVLAVMSYDAVAQKFSNYQALTTPPSGRQVSWPAFTPDGKYIIYQEGVGEDLATWQNNTGKLYAVELATKQVVPLKTLNGDGYMPQGARDEDKNYEPTSAPIASGGYFWVMFTSRRTYGNKLTGGPDTTKRLWVSAVDINATGGVDFSHPAFYISGQELTSGNSRGFWALDPCKQDGGSCESGDECCNGFCNPVVASDPQAYTCGPPSSGGCSHEFEPCKTSADCCTDQQLSCIGGKCTTLPPQ